MRLAVTRAVSGFSGETTQLARSSLSANAARGLNAPRTAGVPGVTASPFSSIQLPRAKIFTVRGITRSVTSVVGAAAIMSALRFSRRRNSAPTGEPSSMSLATLASNLATSSGVRDFGSFAKMVAMSCDCGRTSDSTAWDAPINRYEPNV